MALAIVTVIYPYAYSTLFNKNKPHLQAPLTTTRRGVIDTVHVGVTSKEYGDFKSVILQNFLTDTDVVALAGFISNNSFFFFFS